MTLACEPGSPHDLPVALELLRAAGLPVNGVAERLEGFLVVRDADALVGLCGLEAYGRDGLLRSLVVHPSRRGDGIGAVLVDGILDRAGRMGLADVYLLTTTARDYFLRKGFRDWPREEAPAGIRDSWEFRTGCPTTSAFMKRSLGALQPRIG